MKAYFTDSRRRDKSLILALLLLLAVLPALAQSNTGDPVQLGLKQARELVEAERDAALTIVRWRYYEDNWSSTASFQRYGAFGIDSCVSAVPIGQKRNDVLFGWTFNIKDASGKEYQARVSYDLQISVLCDETHVPPGYGAVATPVPTAQADQASAPDQAAAPAASSASTAGFELGAHVNGLTGQAVNLMRSAGMRWVKEQLGEGGSVETGIQWIKNAHAQNFKILISAKGDHHQLATNFDAYVASYAARLGQLAAAGADALEVWNEPNLDREWPAGQINGARYVDMLRAAYQAIKAANPATIVISGAPAPTGYAGDAGCTAQVCNDDVYMQQMAQAGAANYMDCLGLHYNEGAVSPRANSGDPRNPYPTRYFSSMLNRGLRYFPNAKVCWTELGYLSGDGMPGPIPGGFAWANNTTVAQQAEWIADAARLSRESGRVAMMIVWNLNFSNWGADPMGGYALLRPDGSCPGCESLGAAMRG